MQRQESNLHARRLVTVAFPGRACAHGGMYSRTAFTIQILRVLRLLNKACAPDDDKGRREVSPLGGGLPDSNRQYQLYSRLHSRPVCRDVVPDGPASRWLMVCKRPAAPAETRSDETQPDSPSRTERRSEWPCVIPPAFAVGAAGASSAGRLQLDGLDGADPVVGSGLAGRHGGDQVEYRIAESGDVQDVRRRLCLRIGVRLEVDAH